MRLNNHALLLEVFYNVGEGGIRQLEDSTSPASVFYNVGGGGIIQLGDSSSPTCAFYNVEEGSTM